MSTGLTDGEKFLKRESEPKERLELRAWFIILLLVLFIIAVVADQVLNLTTVAHAEEKPLYSNDNKGSCLRLKEQHLQVVGAGSEEIRKFCRNNHVEL